MIKKIINNLINKDEHTNDWAFIFFTIILICSTIYDYASPNGFKVISWIVRLTIFIICLIFIFIRFIKIKMQLLYIEKIILIFAVSSILITSIVNLKFGYRSLYNPLLFTVIVLGLFSINIVNKIDIFCIIRFCKLYLFIALIHFSISILYNYNIFFNFSKNNFKNYMLNSYKFSFLFTNPNDYGFFMMIAAMLSFSLYLYYKFIEKKNKFYYFFLSIIFFLGILISASRSSMFAFSIFFIMIMINLVREVSFNKDFVKYLLKIFLIGIVVLVLFYNLGIINNFIAKFSTGTSHRYNYWTNFISDQLNQFPSLNNLFGIGYYKVINKINTKHSLHNIFLEVWGRYGLVGAFILFYFFFKIIRDIHQERRIWFLVPIIISFFFHGIFEVKILFNVLRPQLIFFKILLCACLIYRFKESLIISTPEYTKN